MTRRWLLLIALMPIAAGLCRAAGPSMSEEDMIRLCRNELEDRLFAGTAHGETFVVAKELARGAERASLRLELASGEGRKIAGTCVFRDGKLFDLKQ
jgi:hypothetical protein